MEHLDAIIEEYSEELFADLGLVALPEEKKAEIYARLEDHLHKLILDTLTPLISADEIAQVKLSLEEEDHHRLEKIFKRFPQHRANLEQKIREELRNLTLIISEELENDNREQISNAGGETTGV